MSFLPVDSFASGAPRIKDDLHALRRRRPPPTDAAATRHSLLSRPTASRAPPVEIAFLAHYGVPEATLHYAAVLARRQGVSADEALLAEGLVPEETFYRALAHYLGVAFVDRPFELAISSLAAARRGYARLRNAPGGPSWLFAPNGPSLIRLIAVARVVRGRRFVAVTTRARFIEALRRADPSAAPRSAAFLAERVDKDLCVRGCLRGRSLKLFIVALFAVAAGLYAPVDAVRLVCALPLAIAFLFGVFLRLFACAASLEAREGAGKRQSDAQLPVYTIVIALYKEAPVARQLARAIDRLDYPGIMAQTPQAI